MLPVQLPSQKLEVKYTGSWKLVLPMPAYQELMHYVEKFEGECSGACLVDLEQTEKESIFTIGEVFLPEKQKNSGASTDIEADEVGKLVTRLVNEGKPVEKLRCHWHSHAGMSVFHSGTDEDNYKVLKTGEWLVSLVLNKAGEIKASVHYYKPFAFEAVNIPVVVMLADMVHKPEWDENIKKVTEFNTKTAPLSAFWPKTAGQDEYYEGYQSRYSGYGAVENDWQKKRDRQFVESKMYLESFLEAHDLCPITEIKEMWGKASVQCIDDLDGRVKDITLEVDDIREALPRDYEEAGATIDTDRGDDYGKI